MNNTIIITAGEKYTDIDALACGIAYKQLCELKGIAAEVVFPGPLNGSVPNFFWEWGGTVKTKFEYDPQEHKYVVVDISDPFHLAHFVIPANVIGVYDHRWGFADYWREKIGNKAIIQSLGACATLIWEEFVSSQLSPGIDFLSANLLYTAILSNTLNMKAQTTNARDQIALEELKPYTTLPENWAEQYFSDTSKSILAKPAKSMRNDTKCVEIYGISYNIIQVELWDSKHFMKANLELIRTILRSCKNPYAFFTSPSISEGKNYIIAGSNRMQKKLENAIQAKFEKGIVGITDKLWLRKEIMKKLSLADSLN